MSQNKNTLIIGMDPRTVDFSQPGFMPGLTAEKVEAQTAAAQKQLFESGYNSEVVLVNAETASLAGLEATLKSKAFDVIMVGAGIRVPPVNFMLFENMINCIHAHAPHAKITFNTSPMDMLEAIQRRA